jgi:hypothetical protein
MKTKTLASLLLLCGSTAALANIAAEPASPLQNMTLNDTTLGNDAEDAPELNTTGPTDPAPNTTEPAPNSTD